MAATGGGDRGTPRSGLELVCRHNAGRGENPGITDVFGSRVEEESSGLSRIIINDPCPTAHMNEESNSWVVEHVSTARIDPFGAGCFG